MNGKEVAGSNIVDILHGIVRARRTDRQPTGWIEVMGALKEANVPKEYVSNPTALRFLGVGLDTATGPTTPSPRATPIRERLRPRFQRPVSPRPKARRQILGDHAEEEEDEIKWEPLPY